MLKRAKMIPFLRFETLEDHNLSGGTYLSGPHMGVAPPPPHPLGIRTTCVDFQTFLSFSLLIWSNISNFLQS